MLMEPRERLIVALDLPSVEAAQAMVARLGDAVSFYKIGYQLAFAGGLAYAQTLAGAGKRVFLDLKLHDIGNTVREGVKSVARLAATVLTSYDDADLAAAGYDFTVPELVAERAAQAHDIGVDGLVCSAEEAARIRAIIGSK